MAFYPSSLDFVILLPFTVSQKLDKYALQRLRPGRKGGYRLIQEVAPSGPRWRRAALRLCVASGSAGGELWEQRGAEAGTGPGATVHSVESLALAVGKQVWFTSDMLCG